LSQQKSKNIELKISIPENPTVSIKNDKYNPDTEIIKKDFKYKYVQSNRSNFNTTKSPSVLSKDFLDASTIHTTIASGNEQYIASCVVTEQRGNTAGTMWTIAIIQSVSPQGQDKIGIYKFEQNNWVLKTYFYTFRYLGYSVDAEIIEPDNGNKFLWIINESKQSLFAKREVLLSVVNLQNITEANSLNLSWPGAGSQDEYYNPRLTTDNASDNSFPWIYIVASLDSITPNGYHLNAQKFAFVDNAFNSINPNIIYRTEILPIYWPAGGTTEIHYLYSDIAYLNMQGSPKLIFTYSNVPDNTRIWLSSCSNIGTNAQAMGTIDGNGSYEISNSAIASAGGVDQSQLMVVFEENYQNSGDWDLVSARSNDGGNNWVLNYIEASSSSTDFLPHIGTLVSRRTVLDEYYLSYSLNNPADSVMSIHSNSGGSAYWDLPVKMSFGISDYIQSSVGLTNTPGERLTVWSSIPGGNTFQLNGSFYPGLPSSVEDDLNSPNSFVLQQNYPNPFNPSTKIKYSLSSGGDVLLKVFDILGNEVATLVNEEKQSGFYEVTFNASNLAGGIYFYRLSSGGYIQTKKMVLIK
jgi:hypothetical protein